MDMTNIPEFLYYSDMTLPWPTRLGEIILWKTANFDVEAICVGIDHYNPHCRYCVSHIVDGTVQRMYTLILDELMAFARQTGAFGKANSRVYWYPQVQYEELVEIANNCKQTDYISTAIIAYQEYYLRRLIWKFWSSIFAQTLQKNIF